MIKAIIFDCWNTLFYHDNGNWEDIARLLGSPPDESFRMQYTEITNRYKKKLEDYAQELIKTAKQDVKLEELKRLLIPYLNEIHAFPGAFEMLNSLRKKYKLGLLTNVNPHSFKAVVSKFNLEQYFDAMLPSYEIEAVKPEQRIFKEMLKRLNVEPQEAVMVGDNLIDDISGALSVNMHAVLVKRHSKGTDYEPTIKTLSQLQDVLNRYYIKET